MHLKISLYLLLVVWSGQSNALDKRSLSDELSRFISNTKVELVQSFFKSRHVKKDVTKVKLNQEKGLDMNVTIAGDLGGLFRRAEQNFLFNGSQILRLRKENSYDVALSKYSLDAVNDYPLEEGAVFFKQIDWADIFFLVVCYAGAYCRALMSHSTTGITFQQRITTIGTPEDIEFFVESGELYLIIATDPCKIFRWTGTYFDEDDELDTSGARAVTAFQDNDAIIIVVAQNVPSRKVYSKVFVRRHRRTELIQLLHTTEALDVISYSLKAEGESLKFVFIQNNRESSSIFWWDGREFYLWKSLEEIVGPGRVYVDRVHSELFFFFAYENNLRVYHPTEVTFDLVNVLILDREILSFDLLEEKNQPTKLLLLTRSSRKPFLTMNVISIDVNYIPVSDGHLGVTDPVLQCLLDLKETLAEQGVKLQESISLTNEIRKETGTVEMEGLTVDEMELKSFTIQNLKVNPPGVKLEATPTEIRKELERLEEESSSILAEFESAKREIRYRVHDDLVINRLRASHIHVRKFNDRAFDLRNIVSVTKNQTLSGSIRINHLIADTLTVPSINGIPVKDILLRNKPVQEITGEHTLKSMKANSFVVGALGTVNGRPLSNAEEVKTRKTIHGKKTFTHMSVKHIDVDCINNMPAEEWLSKMFPISQTFSKGEALTFKELWVGNLTVSNINGLPWKDYLNRLQTRSVNGTDIANNTKVTHLRTNKINGIPTSSFVTKGTTQNVSSTIQVNTIRASRAELENLDIGTQKVSEEPIIFPSLKASKITFKKPVNISGRIVDFNKLNETYWFKSEAQTIETFLTFTKELTVGDMEALYINKNSVDGFIHLREPNNAAGRIIFEDTEVIGNITLSSSADSRPDLRDWYNSAVKTTGTNHITGKKIFTGEVTVEKLSAHFLNDRNISSDSTIFVPPVLEDVQSAEIVGDVYVKSGISLDYLNGYNFSNIVSTAIKLENPSLLQSGNYTSLTVTNLSVKKINGIDFGNRFISQDGDAIKLVINGDLIAPEIIARKVNDIPFSDYMRKVVLKNGAPQTVKGKKVFTKTVTVKGNFNGVLNGYDLAELQKSALSKSNPQNITGTFIVDTLNANNIDADSVNGLKTDLLLSQEKPTMQTIESDVIFKNFAITGDIKTSNFVNGCDLSKHTNMNWKKVRKIKKLDVKGDVTWNRDRHDRRSLSYIFENAVTKYYEQIISGSVTFSDNATFEKMISKKHINGIDLGFIIEDALYRSPRVQEISQDITFKGTVKADNILIQNNVIVNNINELDILDFGQRLVRNSADDEITGRKEFLFGFNAYNLNTETINGARTDQIIFCDGPGTNGTIKFPPTKFRSIEIIEDLNVLRINQVNLQNLFDERLSKSQDQTVSAHITTTGTLTVKGDVELSYINDVNLNDTVLAFGENSPRSITGKVEWDAIMSVPQRMELETINNYNITDVYERGLMTDTDYIIEGNIIFTEDVEMQGNLEVSTANECDVRTLKHIEIPQDIAYNDLAYRERIQSEINKMENTSNTLIKPIIFVDLEVKARFTLDVGNVQRIAASESVENTHFDIYSQDNCEKCGMLNDCFCLTQTKLTLLDSVESIVVENVAPRYFKYYDEFLDVEVTVTTTRTSYNSTSYNPRRQNPRKGEYTTLTWRIVNNTSENASHEISHNNENNADYLSSVNFFVMGESIYVIMAFYLHPMENETSRMNIVVYQIDTDTSFHEAKIVHEFSLSGVQELDAFWTPKGVVLVIGSAYDSDVFTNSVNTSIYRFSEAENKFEFLRAVRTHGILSISSMRHKKDIFIFLVQKQSWPFLVLKYNHEYDNYYFSQKLDVAHSRVKSNFLSAAAFTTASVGYDGDLFVAIVMSDGSFRLLKYKYIEGFVEELRQEQKNVSVLSPFRFGSEQYLLAVSAGKNSVIYKLSMQGYMN